LTILREIFFFFTSVPKDKEYSNNQTRKSINTKQNKYNRHATTNQKILFLVNEVKKNISLRMVKV